jgi:hypothetical protein
MSSAASTVPGGNRYRKSDPAVSSSNMPLSTSQLLEGSSRRMTKGIRPGMSCVSIYPRINQSPGIFDGLLEDAQDHEITPQRSEPLDRTRQNVQERNQSNDRPSLSSNRLSTRGETNSNPVVAAPSPSRPQGPRPPTSQSKPFSQGNTTSPNSGEQQGTLVNTCDGRFLDYPSRRK